MPAIPADRHGENLPNLTDVEWEKADMAYPNDFLYLLRDSRRVSVFAAAEKAAEYQFRLEERKQQRRLQKRSKKIEEAMTKSASCNATFVARFPAAVTLKWNGTTTSKFHTQVYPKQR